MSSDHGQPQAAEGSDPGDSERDDKQRRFVRRVMIVLGLLAAVAVGLTLMGLAWTAMLTLFGGALIGVLLDGVARQISSWTKMPRRLALGLILLLVIGAAVGASFWVGPALADQAQGMREQLSRAWSDAQSWLAARPWGERVLAELDKLELGSLLSPNVGGMVSTAAGTVTSIVLMFVFGLYFAIDPDTYVDGFVRLFPPRRREGVRELAASVARALRRWLLGRFASMAVVGVGTSLGLWIAGVPLALPLGVLAGLLSFVPNLGPLLAALPGILIGLSKDPATALWAALVYAGVQVLENYAITPLIQHRAVSLPPALLIGVQMLMGLSAGVIGLFMATPLLVTVVVLVQILYLREVLDDEVELIGEPGEGEGGEPEAAEDEDEDEGEGEDDGEAERSADDEPRPTLGTIP